MVLASARQMDLSQVVEPVKLTTQMTEFSTQVQKGPQVQVVAIHGLWAPRLAS